MKSGYIKIIVATLLFSVNPLLFKLIDLNPINILWTVNIIAVFVLLLRLSIQKRVKDITGLSKSYITLIALGIFFAINNVLFIYSIKLTTIGNAILTHYLAPVFVMIFGIFLVKEKLTKISTIALLLSVIGLTIILLPNELTLKNVHFLGLILGTLSAIFFSLEILLKKILAKSYDADIIVILYLFISIFLLIPFISINKILSVGNNSLIILLASGVIASALGITLFTSGLKDVKAQNAGIISYIEPLGAMLWGYLIISELPVMETFIGGGLILLGTFLILKFKKNNNLIFSKTTSL
jgi:drug/metabolite transporter (DMT)-like permease